MSEIPHRSADGRVSSSIPVDADSSASASDDDSTITYGVSDVCRACTSLNVNCVDIPSVAAVSSAMEGFVMEATSATPYELVRAYVNMRMGEWRSCRGYSEPRPMANDKAVQTMCDMPKAVEPMVPEPKMSNVYAKLKLRRSKRLLKKRSSIFKCMCTCCCLTCSWCDFKRSVSSDSD